MQNYPMIRLWGRMLGSMAYYIEDEVKRAKADKAPQDAVYYDMTNKVWHTYREVTSQDTKDKLRLWLMEYYKKTPEALVA